MDEHPPPLPNAVQVSALEAPETDGRAGPPCEFLLRGPLILTAISRIVSIPLLLAATIRSAKPLLRPHIWSALVSPVPYGYHPLFPALFLYDLACTLSMFLFNVLLAYLFLGRRAMFRPLMIYYIAFSLMDIWVDHHLGQQIPSVRRIPGRADFYLAFGFFVVLALIWLPYYLLSKRVQRVFVK